MKKILVFCLIILFFSCTNIRQQSDLSEENYLQNDVSAATGQEARLRNRDHWGIIYNTTVNTDGVNLHWHPTLQSHIRRRQIPIDETIRVVGVSTESDTIDGYTGHWLRVEIDGQHQSWVSGWIFSKYVNIETITPNELTIVGLAPEEPGQARRLNGFFMSGNTEIQFSVSAHRQASQPFWTFVWNALNIDFRFDTSPGSYAWFPETGELRHITYLGDVGTASWVSFTDDFRYFIQDNGSRSFEGLRNVTIRRVSNNNVVFYGLYLDDIRLNGLYIEIASSPSNSRTSLWLDEEIIKFAENFRQNNPKPADMVQRAQETGMVVELVIIWEYNIESETRRILRGEYILTFPLDY